MLAWAADLCRLYHVTSGSGIPVTLHVSDTVPPSLTVTSSLDCRPITDAGTANISLIGCLHDPANVQQTSSKCIQNTRELLDVCWTFAGSCRHPISLQLQSKMLGMFFQIQCSNCHCHERCNSGVDLKKFEGIAPKRLLRRGYGALLRFHDLIYIFSKIYKNVTKCAIRPFCHLPSTPSPLICPTAAKPVA